MLTKDTRGSAVIEFAFVAAVLIPLAFGVADFGRVFSAKVTSVGAATTGAASTAESFLSGGDTLGARQRALNDAAGLTGSTATASQYCECPPTGEISCSDLKKNTCSGYGPARVYMKVKLTHNFALASWLPSLPLITDTSHETWIRVR